MSACCAAGLDHRAIARVLEVSAPTLRKHFSEELTRSAEDVATHVDGAECAQETGTAAERQSRRRRRAGDGERVFPLALPCEALRTFLVGIEYVDPDEAHDIEKDRADYDLALQQLEALILDLLRGIVFMSRVTRQERSSARD